jgi:hypothetical protein
VHFRLSFALNLKLRDNSERSVQVMDASGWAQKIAQEKRTERKKKETEDAKTLSDRALIASKAPEIWAAFKQAVQRHVQEITNAMDGEQVIRTDPKQRSDRMVIIDKNGRELCSFVFNGDSVATQDDIYKFVVPGTSDLAWHSEKFGNFTLESIALTAVERAFRQCQ